MVNHLKALTDAKSGPQQNYSAKPECLQSPEGTGMMQAQLLFNIIPL